MYKYEVLVYWSYQDECYVAEVPELPGCMAHGESNEEALHNANDAIELWIDTAREHGDFVPQAKGKLVFA